MANTETVPAYSFELEVVEGHILSLLSLCSGPIDGRAIVDAFQGYWDEKILRAAVWNLVDKGKVEFSGWQFRKV